MSLLELLSSAVITALVFGASLLTWTIDNRVLERAQAARSVDDQANTEAEEALARDMNRILQSSSGDAPVDELVYHPDVIMVQNGSAVQRLELVGRHAPTS